MRESKSCALRRDSDAFLLMNREGGRQRLIFCANTKEIKAEGKFQKLFSRVSKVAKGLCMILTIFLESSCFIDRWQAIAAPVCSACVLAPPEHLW